jgi:hypothetical protein
VPSTGKSKLDKSSPSSWRAINDSSVICSSCSSVRGVHLSALSLSSSYVSDADSYVNDSIHLLPVHLILAALVLSNLVLWQNETRLTISTERLPIVTRWAIACKSVQSSCIEEKTEVLHTIGFTATWHAVLVLLRHAHADCQTFLYKLRNSRFRVVTRNKNFCCSARALETDIPCPCTQLLWGNCDNERQFRLDQGNLCQQASSSSRKNSLISR